MTTTLPNGTRVPDVASTSWAGDLEVNWQLLDAAIGAIGSNVQTNRPNTWTAEQTFSEPIVGNLTGTASKAGADEDGTSIKTGYVNVAGNQTVTGQKTWTALNSYNQSIQITTNFDIGAAPSSEVSGGFNFGNGTSNIGNVTARVNSGGTTYSRLYIGNKFANGALDPNGTWKYAELQVGLRANGDRFIYTDGLWRNNLTPYNNNTYSLGSSSYQWSSVYAQTYYYNGTAWGLDKANVWTGTNTFQQNIMYERTNFFHQAVNPSYILKDTGLEKGSLPLTAHTAYPGLWHDKNNAILGYMRFVAYDTGKQTAEIRVSNLIKNGALDPTGSVVNCAFLLELQPSGEKSLIPEQNNDISLGTSTNKWKTLNGINPGALSLPKNANSASFNIDTTNWTTDGSIIIYTPLLDGWLYINARNDDTNGDSFIIFDDGVSGFGTSVFGNKGLQNSGVGLLCLMMPVNKNNYINIRIKSPGIISARLYPCNGNV